MTKDQRNSGFVSVAYESWKQKQLSAAKVRDGECCKLHRETSDKNKMRFEVKERDSGAVLDIFVLDNKHGGAAIALFLSLDEAQQYADWRNDLYGLKSKAIAFDSLKKEIELERNKRRIDQAMNALDEARAFCREHG